MILLRRRRQGNAVPRAFRHPRSIESARNLVEIYYASQATGKFEFDSGAWKPAKVALRRETADKCAYCEAPTALVAHGDVEHFRPKSTYWWLVFCLDNYLYSCQICNQSYKGDKFPFAGARLPAPMMPAAIPAGQALDALATGLILDASQLDDDHFRNLWSNEDADLVNPYLEDPEPFFSYEVDFANEEIWIRSTGSVRADRAAAAAESVLGLNREELLRARYAMYLPFVTFKGILESQISEEVRSLALEEFRRMQGSAEPFAGMRRYFASTWRLPGPL